MHNFTMDIFINSHRNCITTLGTSTTNDTKSSVIGKSRWSFSHLSQECVRCLRWNWAGGGRDRGLLCISNDHWIDKGWVLLASFAAGLYLKGVLLFCIMQPEQNVHMKGDKCSAIGSHRVVETQPRGRHTPRSTWHQLIDDTWQEH